MKFRVRLARLAFAAVLAAAAATAHADAADAEAAPCRHAYAFLGEPKLPPDFEHFDWVNPDAPKGGLMRMASMGSWDSFNRMALGRSVRGMDTRGDSNRHIYDSLAIRNPTEIATIYGLLAECIAVAPDGAWVEFRLRDGAYWHDGEPLDVADVAFSFSVYQDKAQPEIATGVAAFSRVEILDGNRIRYHVRPPYRDNRLLPIRIGELPVLSKRYWTQPGNDPGKPAARPPVGSGPYRIGGYEFGRWILWERDPDYWGRDLPVNRGRYNFDRVKYDYFRDDQMRTEAVKGDLVDIHVGWVVEDKRLVHERTGEPFFIRFVAFSPALARSLIPYTHVLRRLGIESFIKSPELTNWLYRMRSGDFDAGVNWFRPDNTPTLIVTNTFSTAAADQDLSANWGNIRNPAIDRLIQALQSAVTYPDYVAAARAIDRVLLWNFYYIPGMAKVKVGVAYWDRFGQPPPTPLDRTAFIDSWWWDPAKARAIAEFTGRE